MKKLYLVSFITLSCLGAHAQLFQQAFSTDMATVTNGASTDANYVAEPPGPGQFTYLAAPTSATVAVSSGSLKTTSTSTGSRWVVVRNGNFAPAPSAVMAKFDANIAVGSSGSTTPKFVFYFGSGLTNNTTMDANTAIHSGFAIRYQNSGYYYISTLSGTVLTTQYTESVNRTFSFVTNNSGGALTYTAPDGTTESIADDKWDLWIDQVKVFDEQVATTNSQALNNFKFGDINGSNGRADWVLDNLSITDINPPLPVKFASFTAALKGGFPEVKWSAVNEQNLSHYELERSADGRVFDKVSAVNALNGASQNNYSYADVTAKSGNNYYRLKSVEKDGKTFYTNVLKVSSTIKAEVAVTPNPVTGNSINLQLTGMTKGTYTARLYNAAGLLMADETLRIEAGSSVQTLPLKANRQSGNYFLVLTNGSETYRAQVVIK